MFIFDLSTDIHRTILPFQVKGVRVDMPRPLAFQAREKGIVTHPAYPLRNVGVRVPWPPARLSEYIRDKDMKSDINIKKQTASNLKPINGNVWTAIVVQDLRAKPQFFPVLLR
jgi:hypothetical protein